MIHIVKQFLLISIATLFIYSCKFKSDSSATLQPGSMGVLSLTTQFYDSSGTSIFLAPMKIWYKDSVAIEELVTIKSITDTFGKTEESFVPEAYRYINLKRHSWQLYITLSDTARIIESGALPDSVFVDGGWTFYANNMRMESDPELMPDSIIGETKYMRIKFFRLNARIPDSYVIGYLRCDKKENLFSLEKTYSHSVNCAMTRYYEFKNGASRPFASTELEFLSDTLTEKELKVFAAWEKNSVQNKKAP